MLDMIKELTEMQRIIGVIHAAFKRNEQGTLP